MNHNISKLFFYYPATTLKGEMVYKYLRTYRRFQFYDRKRIRKYKEAAAGRILNYAYNNTKFYRRLYDSYSVKPSDFETLDDLSKFPTISKQDLVASADDLKSAAVFPCFISKKTTGGSTGRVVTVFKNPCALGAGERAATWRAYEWAGVSIGSPQARFWGGVPLSHLDKTKYRIIDFISNRIRLSAFAISDKNFEKYFILIHQFRPEYLYGYASLIHEFVLYLKRFSKRLPSSLKAVITTSEVLTLEVRNDIQSILGLKVFNEYGCGEVGSIAHECEQGRLHIMEDNLHVELDSTKFQENEGELIITDFFNTAMPLIRYRLGDFAKMAEGACSCGRTLGVIEEVYGRAYDMLLAPDGSKVHPEYIMYIFESLKKRFPWVNQFQMIQTSIEAVKVNIVKEANYDSARLERFVCEKLKDKLSPNTSVSFDFVDSIPREASGKLRLVKSML